ncbi:hypothetical protein GQE99_14445 [Maritimibacter sp. DP07]|uniref:Uncharacterized protein n=1 Tax=Maritimibacter harenae TaxID=2606218 RepID=A0A845M5C5_9RHOB|nr:hypothetical protein [Maritimibacter harenae]MZR14219.1 hypothetical protein [Maritimibacter harenae]
MPTWLIQLAVGVALTALSVLLKPKPEPPKAATFDDLDIPRVDEGTEIGIVFGTMWIESPSVAWYGDFDARPVYPDSNKKK